MDAKRADKPRPVPVDGEAVVRRLARALADNYVSGERAAEIVAEVIDVLGVTDASVADGDPWIEHAFRIAAARMDR